METLTDAAMWAVIVGFISPLVIAVFQQPTWTKGKRAIATFVWSLIVGSGTAFFAGAFSGMGVVSCILLVLVTSISTYKGLWGETGATKWVEEKTSPTP